MDLLLGLTTWEAGAPGRSLRGAQPSLLLPGERERGPSDERTSPPAGLMAILADRTLPPRIALRADAILRDSGRLAFKSDEKEDTMRSLLFAGLLALAVNPVGQSSCEDHHQETVTQSLDPGQFNGYDVSGPYTGLMRKDGTKIGEWDDPSAFARPDAWQANQLWFSSGWMSWGFLVNIPGDSKIDSVSYTAELSSECPSLSCPVWPSDLTVTMNGHVIDNTWTIPGDLSAGWLATWTVNSKGTFFEAESKKDGNFPRRRVSDVTVCDLQVTPGENLNVKLAVEFTPTGGGLTILGYSGSYYPGNTPTIRVNYTSPSERAIREE